MSPRKRTAPRSRRGTNKTRTDAPIAHTGASRSLRGSSPFWGGGRDEGRTAVGHFAFTRAPPQKGESGNPTTQRSPAGLFRPASCLDCFSFRKACRCLRSSACALRNAFRAASSCWWLTAVPLSTAGLLAPPPHAALASTARMLPAETEPPTELPVLPVVPLLPPDMPAQTLPPAAPCPPPALNPPALNPPVPKPRPPCCASAVAAGMRAKTASAANAPLGRLIHGRTTCVRIRSNIERLQIEGMADVAPKTRQNEGVVAFQCA